MHHLKLSLVLALLTMTSTALLAAAPLSGEWGGDQVRLTLDATGGRIEYSCGAGTIDVPLQTDAQGHFSARGMHEARTPGPTRADSAPASQAATYRGRVDGDRMTLTVEVSGGGTPLQYNLIRGRSVKLIRCF